MRFSAPILSIVALSVLAAPALPTLGASSDLLHERLTQTELPTLAQTSSTSAMQAEADRLYLQGAQQFNTSQYQAAFESWQAALELYREIDSSIREGDTLNALGLLFRIAGQPQNAIDYHQQALAISREIDDRTGESLALGNLGIVYDSLGQYERAIDFYQQALGISREISDRFGEGRTLVGLGNAYFSLGQYERAIDFHQQALAISREIDDHLGEGAALTGLGNSYSSLSQYERAIDFHQQALVIVREIRNRAGEAAALGNLGNAYANQGQYELAINLYQQQLTINREIGVRTGEGRALGNLGIAYASLGQYERAINRFEQQLAIAREIGDRAEEGNARGNLGNAYLSLGQYELAINFNEQRLEIAREVGDRAGEGAALGNLGIAYANQGQYELALEHYEQWLFIAQEIGDRAGEGAALGAMGGAYLNLGQYERAINLYQRKLTITREIGDRAGEGNALGRLANVYRNLGQYERAIDHVEQQLNIAREIGDRAAEASGLGILGTTYARLSQYELAINYFEQQLVIVQETGARAAEGRALGYVGIAYASLGQFERAIDLHEQHLVISQATSDRAGEGLALGNLGIVYLTLRQYERAISYFEQQLVIAQEIGDRTGEAIAFNNQGLAQVAIRQFPQAEFALSQSIEVHESLRVDLTDEQLISLADTQSRAYANLELALVEQNKTAEALAISERGRARAFVLKLANRLAPSDQPSLTEAPTVAEVQQIARYTNTTLVTYSLIFNQALHIWVVQPTGAIHFRSVQFDGADRPIINPITSLDRPIYRSAPDSALTALVNDSRSIGVFATNPESNPQSLQSLHEILIDPIADLLPSDPNDPVAFIPQGNLFLVPFAALQDDDGTYLIEKHTLLTAPSIQVFGLANASLPERSRREQNRRERFEEQALIVGNPTMPTVWLPNISGEFAQTALAPLYGAQLEAEAIGNLFQIPALIGDQASEARIKQLLPDASLIHLATHGLLEYGNPETSGVLDVPGAVALAPGQGEDGLLTSAEILAMDLQAELAILSACDTGRGRITGDGVVGLSRALITAGVPSVMVSLWAVNDDSTSLLMQRFYELLASGELTKAQALRQAQLSLLYSEDVETRLASFRAGARPQSLNSNTLEGYQQPYHWAPFVLMGDGS